MPTSSSGPFWVDEQRDFSQASESRYGVYIRHRLRMFEDLDGRAVTTDPVEFTAAAWEIATGPIMAPAYVRSGNPRIHSVTCRRNNWDGSMLADVTLATPRPAELRRIAGFREWERFGQNDDYIEPSEDGLTKWPAMLTSTRLLFPVPVGRLHVPKDAPDQVSTSDAKASVLALAEVLNEFLTPVLDALDGPSGNF